MKGKYIFPLLSIAYCLFLLIPARTNAGTPDTRSDSFSVSHYSISLDLSKLSTQTISGYCIISGASKINGLNRLSLELYKLNVDSVMQNGKIESYKYNDSLLTVKLIKHYNVG